MDTAAFISLCRTLAASGRAPRYAPHTCRGHRRFCNFLIFLLTSGALYGGQVHATQRYTDKRLDVNLGLTDQGLLLRHRQNVRAYDCRVSINDKYHAVNVTIPGGRETLLPFGQFRTLNNDPYDPTLEIQLVRIQCLSPSLRLRTFRRR